ncbi:MAG: molybdopterin-guanine dinucleotide biosynthesis protein MobB, partial [Sulfuricurvum sp.]|nr:molybdopterin-guanine dinucleotide biosynthesis protein MobB [Sulfuricurvum sp.]
LPRISIFRNSIDTDYFPYMNALAIDESIDTAHYAIPEGIEILDLNNPDHVIEWILAHAKVME